MSSMGRRLNYLLLILLQAPCLAAAIVSAANDVDSIYNKVTKPDVSLWTVPLPAPETITTTATTTKAEPSSPRFEDLVNLFQRELAVGDFNDLNVIYSGISIPLPDTSFTERVLFSTLTLDITNLRCFNIAVGDIDFTYQWISNQQLSMTLNVIQFDINCSLDYHYDWLFNGHGQADAFTDNNSANISWIFSSPDFTQQGPDSFDIQSCAASIDVTDLDFHGGFGSGAQILNAADRLLRSYIATQTEGFVCDALNNFNKSVTKLLTFASDFIDPYLNVTMDDGIGNNTLEYSSNSTWLNFQEPNGTLATLVNTLMHELSSFLGSSSNGDLHVNELMRSYLLNNSDTLELDLSTLPGIGSNGTLLEGGGNFTDTSLTIDTVHIAGLDSFNYFEPFKVVDDYELQASFAMDYLSLGADVTWVIRPPNPDSTSPNVTQNLALQLDVSQINVTATLFLGVKQNLLEGLPLGAFLNGSNILDCLLSIVEVAEVSNLDVHVGDLGVLKASGFTSPGLGRIANTTLNAIFDMYHAALLRAIPGFFQTNVRSLFNNATHRFLQEKTCPSSLLGNTTSNSMIDWRDMLLPPAMAVALGGSGASPYGGIGSLLKQYIDSQLLAVDNTTSLPGINKALIAPYTKRQSGTEGTLERKGDLLSVYKDLNVESLHAKIQLRVNNARIENLVMGDPLSLLDPVNNEAYILDNTATLGASGFPPMQLRASVFFALESKDGFNMTNELELDLGIPMAGIYAKTLLEVYENKLLSFPLADIFNLNCWLATIPAPTLDVHGIRLAGTDPSAGFKELNVSISAVNINASCIACSSPGVKELEALLAQPSISEQASQSARNVIHQAIDFLNGGYLQVQIDRMINEAPKKCPHSPSFQPNAAAAEYAPFETESTSDSFGFLLALLVTTLSIIFGSVLLSGVVRFIVRRRHRKWIASLPAQRVIQIYKIQDAEEWKKQQINGLSKSMFSSPSTPCLARWLIPVIVIGNIALFLSGHLSIAGSVSIRVQIAGQALVVDDFYSFSIANSAIELWNAGGKVLAVLIILFSGVWPYTKQLVTLILWFLPPRFLSVFRRGLLFEWLDFLAKWSVVDIYFMIISLVAFRVTIVSPNMPFLPENFYKVDLFVIPLWGLYANMIAQLVSQVSSHFIIYYHRRAVKQADKEYHDHIALDNQDDEIEIDSFNVPSYTPNEEPTKGEQDAEALRDHAFTRPHRGETEKVKVKPLVPALLYLVAALVFALIIAGCILPSFAFTPEGIVGVLISSSDGFHKDANEQSVFSIAGLLEGEARLLNTAKAYVGLTSIVILFLLTTFLMPLIEAVVLVVQFMVSLRRATRAKLASALEVIHDWQYVEVYVVSILITTSQLGNVSEYLVNPYCDSLKGALSSLVYYGLIDDSDAQCFRVQAGISSGTYVLLTGAVVLAILHSFVTKAAAQYERDRVWKEDATFPTDYQPPSDMDAEKAVQRIRPVPVLFTDTFRWCVQGCPSSSSSSSSSPPARDTDAAMQSPTLETTDMDESLDVVTM